MRKIKLFMSILIIIIAIIFVMKITNNREYGIGEVISETSINKQNILEKQTVINKLTESFQVVGITGKIEKDFTYSNNKWNGKKQLNIKLHGAFKIGFNIADIERENISISGNHVTVDMPKLKLISLELPYDDIEIVKELGIFRTDFSEEDRQLIYSTARISIVEEIMKDETFMNNALVSNQKALKAILMLIPQVESVSFK